MRIIIAALFVLQANAIVAQAISQKQKNKNLKYVLKKASKLECDDKTMKYSTLMIYWFDHHHLHKEDFTNETLIGSLEIIPERKKKWPSSDIIIFNQQGRVVAYSEGLNVYCDLVNHFSHKYFVDYYLKNNPEIFFKISGTDGSIYFSKKDNQITVLEFGSKGFVEYSLEDYKNCCWNTFLPPMSKE